jgi:hypothetical protein
MPTEWPKQRVTPVVIRKSAKPDPAEAERPQRQRGQGHCADPQRLLRRPAHLAEHRIGFRVGEDALGTDDEAHGGSPG